MILEYMPYGDLKGFLASHKYVPQLGYFNVVYDTTMNLDRPDETGYTRVRDEQFQSFAQDVSLTTVAIV